MSYLLIWLHSDFYLPFNLTHRVKGVCKDRICACMVLLPPFPLMWYATWQLSREQHVLTFDPNLGVEGVWKDRICACIVLYASFPLIWYATWQHSENDHVLKHLILTFYHPQGRGRWSMGKIFVNASIHFNSICTMTIFWKRLILGSASRPKFTQGPDLGLRAQIPIDMLSIYCTSVCMRNISKNIDNWLSYCWI